MDVLEIRSLAANDDYVVIGATINGIPLSAVSRYQGLRLWSLVALMAKASTDAFRWAQEIAKVIPSPALSPLAEARRYLEARMKE